MSLCGAQTPSSFPFSFLQCRSVRSQLANDDRDRIACWESLFERLIQSAVQLRYRILIMNRLDSSALSDRLAVGEAAYFPFNHLVLLSNRSSFRSPVWLHEGWHTRYLIASRSAKRTAALRESNLSSRSAIGSSSAVQPISGSICRGRRRSNRRTQRF